MKQGILNNNHLNLALEALTTECACLLCIQSCIACDALPQEVVEAAPLSFASIKYHREVPMGQSVQVFYAPSGNGWYVLGRREEHAAFECYLEFGGSVTESLQK